MPTEFSRLDRIQSSMQMELSKIMQREIKDPRLKLITLTGIKVSPDLSIAKIFFVAHKDDDQKEILKKLKQVSSFLRYELAQELDLRKMPQLIFVYDHSIAHGDRISKLLDEGE